MTVAVAATAIALLVGAAQSDAAFSGANGVIAIVQGGDINVVAPDGSNARGLVASAGLDSLPAWSSDGTKLAYQSTVEGSNWEVFVANADGTGQTRLTFDAATDTQPSWSPDGTRIAFVRNFDIYVMNADGTGARPLASNYLGNDYAPAWSPDGSLIAFASDRDRDFEIYVVTPEGTSLRQITFNSSDDAYPDWSPDGSRIAYHGERAGNADIYVVGADGQGDTPLTSGSAADITPAWSPDGTMIAFTSDRDSRNYTFVMASNGSNQRRVTTLSTAENWPDWQPTPQLRYVFGGFRRPLLATGWNVSTAGAAIPVKFTVTGTDSLSVVAPDYPVSQAVDCATKRPLGSPHKTITAGSSGLSHDRSTGQYTYGWKTDREWRGTCRAFTLRLADATTDYTALFRFR